MNILAQQIPRVVNDTNFETMILVLCLILLVITKLLFKGFFGKVFLLQNESAVESKNAIGFFFGIIFLILVSLLSLPLVTLPEINDYFTSKPAKFFILFVLIGVFFAIKALLTYVFHTILNSYETFLDVVVVKTSNIAWFVVLALLLCLYYYYTPFPKEYFGAVFLATYLVIKIADWYLYFTKLNPENNLRWYEKILYLCTLELLPIAVIVKFLYL